MGDGLEVSGPDFFLIEGLDRIEDALRKALAPFGAPEPLQGKGIMSADRAEYIRTKVRTALDEMAQDAFEWDDIPTPPGLFEPLWIELRDAVVSAIFDMDREQVEHDRIGDEIRQECL
jgi:hypothetical protein